MTSSKTPLSTPLAAPPLRRKAQDEPLQPNACPCCGVDKRTIRAVNEGMVEMMRRQDADIERLKTMLSRAVNAWLKTINSEKI